MPKPDAWMPLYIADYIADTAHLTMAESGAYLHLLMAYWRNGGPISADEGRLRRIVRMTNEEWDEVRETVLEFFTEQNGTLVHHRVEKELSEASTAYEAQLRRTAAATAARAKRNVTTDVTSNVTMNVTTDVTLSQPQPQPQPQLSKRVEGSSSPDTLVALSATDERETPKPEDSDDRRKRGRRIAPDWQPSDRDRDFARDEGLDEREIDRAAAEFRDYWTAAPGRNACKLDWSATWRGRIRQIAERRFAGRSAPARQERRGVVEIAAELAAEYAARDVSR